MKTHLILCIASFLLMLGCNAPKQTNAEADQLLAFATVDTSQLLTTIAFGSCNRQDEPQPLWEEVIAQQPDLWIWLGDNIYADTDDMDSLRQMYQTQLDQPDYQRLYTQVPIVGIWDDHDYGVNDGGKNYAEKVESRNAMLEFLHVSADQSVWNRAGGYQSYTFGPAGKQVKIILLDTRYFRDSLADSEVEGHRYDPNPDGDVLGENQWVWLENELSKSTAQLNIIGSSIQVIANEHWFEKWGNFPKARQRLLNLIAASDAEGVVILSGDRHFGEISRMELPEMEYPLYDITSSGLTHVYEEANEENLHRVSDLAKSLNYGLIQINWQASPPQVTYQIKGENEVTFADTTVTYP
ncbi:MAG: alkaline phosphatase D family protein [Cyclobacteriaceae bacterium]